MDHKGDATNAFEAGRTRVCSLNKLCTRLGSMTVRRCSTVVRDGQSDETCWNSSHRVDDAFTISIALPDRDAKRHKQANPPPPLLWPPTSPYFVEEAPWLFPTIAQNVFPSPCAFAGQLRALSLICNSGNVRLLNGRNDFKLPVCISGSDTEKVTSGGRQQERTRPA